MNHCLPYAGPTPFDRAPQLRSTSALKQMLDVSTKACAFDGPSSLFQQVYEGTHVGCWLFRNVTYVLTTPLRLAMVLIYGLGQLINECPRHGLQDQHRVIWRIAAQTALTAFMTMGSYIEPLLHPYPNIRTRNIADVRSASMYAQADMPREAVSGLFGWIKTSFVSEDLSSYKMSGLCWGKTVWMAAMHLHGKTAANDPNSRLRAVARSFQLGAPPEALLLHQLADHVSVRPGWFERVCGRAMSMVKPIRFQAFYRGLAHYLLGKHSLGITESIKRARDTADQALREMREQASVAGLVGLRTFGTRCFRPLQADSYMTYADYSGIADMADGTYLVTTENSADTMRHAVLYVRSENGQKGVFYDPNVGLELGHEGKDHWKALVDIAGRCHHNVISLTRVEKRRPWDCGVLDVRRRFAEFLC